MNLECKRLGISYREYRIAKRLFKTGEYLPWYQHYIGINKMSIHSIDVVFLNILFIVTFTHDEDHCVVTKLMHGDDDILPLFEEDSDTLQEIEGKCMDYIKWLGA